MANRILVAVRGTYFIVTDPENAFGDMPEEMKESIIKHTADDIVVNELIDSLSPLLVQTSGQSTSVTIEELKRGLETLGVEDTEAEIQAARKRVGQSISKS